MGNGQKGKRKETILLRQIFLSKWRGCSFLGEDFSTVEIGRKWCYWCSLDADVPSDIGYRVVPEHIILFLRMGLCRRTGWLP